jgi:trans-aconitate methyltransferase
MFTETADLYDLIYSQFKDYRTETNELAALIRQHHPRAKTILDVACGTAEHAKLLADEHGFDVDGLDLDGTFARIARGKLTRGSVYEADMTSFELPRRYDVVMCLFSSIGYVRTLENVRRTLERFGAHLADHGVIFVEPWFSPDAMHPGHVTVTTARTADLAVARVSRLEVEGRLSRLYFEYLIARASGIEHARETHELGLFTTDEMSQCFRDAGLDVMCDEKGPSGRGLFLARRGRSASIQ